jgi:hypothetical protein
MFLGLTTPSCPVVISGTAAANGGTAAVGGGVLG